MSVIERETRSFTKNAEDAPFLGIALPTRKKSPVDFWMSIYQLIPPMNVNMGFMIQKAAEKNVVDGKLPAEARNALIERALSRDMNYLFFLDDDVLFPDITLNRMMQSMLKHPEIACITAVGVTKLTPCEPLIYKDAHSGPYWDFHLGALMPIHSAWAGCMLVNMEYVKKLKGPWFNDVVKPASGEMGHYKRNIWGQDRYFHMRLREEAGGLIMADTGILVGHYDADQQKCYIMPPDAPCFNKPFLGESFITHYDNDGYITWTRVLIRDEPVPTFNQWLEDLASKSAPEAEITMVPQQPKETLTETREGYTVTDSRGRTGEFNEWFKSLGVEE